MIFADSSFWLALYFSRDQRHADAQALLRAYGRKELLTSNYVRGETWTLLRRRVGHRVAVHFLTRLERSRFTRLVVVDEELEAEALRWLRRHDERPYSYADAVSFALMRSLKIREALAFDGDFTAAGFVELRPKVGETASPGR